MCVFIISIVSGYRSEGRQSRLPSDFETDENSLIHQQGDFLRL